MARQGLGSALLWDGSGGLGTSRCLRVPEAIPMPRGARRGSSGLPNVPGSPAGPLGVWRGLGTAASSRRRRKRAELAAGGKLSHGAQHHDQSHAGTQEMLSGAGLWGGQHPGAAELIGFCLGVESGRESPSSEHPEQGCVPSARRLGSPLVGNEELSCGKPEQAHVFAHQLVPAQVTSTINEKQTPGLALGNHQPPAPL